MAPYFGGRCTGVVELRLKDALGLPDGCSSLAAPGLSSSPKPHYCTAKCEFNVTSAGYSLWYSCIALTVVGSFWSSTLGFSKNTAEAGRSSSVSISYLVRWGVPQELLWPVSFRGSTSATCSSFPGLCAIEKLYLRMRIRILCNCGGNLPNLSFENRGISGLWFVSTLNWSFTMYIRTHSQGQVTARASFSI